MILRHGDVLLRKIDSIPEVGKLKVKHDNILEYGEVSGHSHQLIGATEAITVYTDPNTEQTADYVEIDASQLVNTTEVVELVHEEHDRIQLDPGFYEVVRQRELNPYDSAVRAVQD